VARGLLCAPCAAAAAAAGVEAAAGVAAAAGVSPRVSRASPFGVTAFFLRGGVFACVG
jgi:hypothetical protein